MMAANKLRGTLAFNELMAKHTSWRVGGPAQRYYQPADLDDLAEFLSQTANDEPLLWLGLGSNLLVRDGGVRGTVIATAGLLNSLSLQDETLVRVEAGVACAKVARFCARQGLVGGEFLAGIPGTMGGALTMNAGAFGGETWGQVERVEMLSRHGEVILRQPEEFDVSYRHVRRPKNEFFVAAYLRLQAGDSDAASQRIKTLLAKRNETQPIGQASCGSVFRNPEGGDYAARLIEACGLKGARMGDACVSKKHANFIINTDAATATDIEKLMAKIETAVEEKFDVTLVREVHVVGEVDSSW